VSFYYFLRIIFITKFFATTSGSISARPAINAYLSPTTLSTGQECTFHLSKHNLFRNLQNAVILGSAFALKEGTLKSDPSFYLPTFATKASATV
jgi:hypothetical protein